MTSTIGRMVTTLTSGDVVGELSAQRAIGRLSVSGVAELDDGDGTGCCQNVRHGGVGGRG